RTLAQDILARSEFDQAKAPEPWIARLLHLFFDWLGKIEFLHGHFPLLYWIVLIGLLLVLIALVAHIAWTILIALRAPEPAEAIMMRPQVRDLAAEAESLAASGRYLEAAHRMMIASFRCLSDRAVIELRPDRSNLWIRGAIGSSRLNQGLAREIDTLVTRTEWRWFGDRRNDPAIYADWRSVFERLAGASSR